MRSYCTQNKGRCWSCPLSRQGQDCQKNLAMWWDVNQAALAWGISKRHVNKLLAEGLVHDAELIVENDVYHWRIPIDTPSPSALGFETVLKYT